ncbi:MAG: ABC transporter ATP-binding protein [Polyangiaceae bacterium]
MNARLGAYFSHLAPPSNERPREEGGGLMRQASFWCELRQAGMLWRCCALLGSHLLATFLLLASWASIGSGALTGRLDRGWLVAWGLALASTVPLRFLSRWLEGVIAVGVGGLLKQRLFAGALSTDAERIAQQGAGQALSECLEAEAIEAVGASGGLQIALALLELSLVPVLMYWGAAFKLECAVLVGSTVLFAAFAVASSRLLSEWTDARLRLTRNLVESMSAHRTRLAQQPPSQWHQVEDRQLESYAGVSERLDCSLARIAVVTRIYSLAAVAALVPSVASGNATPELMAVTLGTVLFASLAWERMAFGFFYGAEAWTAWRFAAPLFRAVRSQESEAEGTMATSRATTLLRADELGFRHQGSAEPVLKGCSLSVTRGERILLQGESGSGKSTFAALLAGLREPSSGFVVAGGLDRLTLGERAWRSRVAMAPQYHENHVLSGSLGFNLLLARAFPHSPQDYADAQQVCEDLGLGGLLKRMPSGLHQIVGETGWRLSQGEVSRVFLARALLQGADVVILDESLAALDPSTLSQCLDAIYQRASALILIAHP